MLPTGWKTIAASVAGFSHQAGGTPCQDSHAISSLANGWIVGVVSDGAGSAIRCAEGSKAVCDELVPDLVSRITVFTGTSDGNVSEAVLRQWLTDGIERIRTLLVEHSTQGSLAEFHATVVGVIAGPNGGWFFHIGDGAACATNTQTFSPCISSLPENGEYANETYFFTQANWLEHLRLTPFDQNFNLVALMSDGVTPFALAPGGTEPHVPFFGPVSRYFEQNSREESERALVATLEKDAIRKITGDDKTLLWAMRISANG
jgi:Protein phosphatase 2C